MKFPNYLRMLLLIISRWQTNKSNKSTENSLSKKRNPVNQPKTGDSVEEARQLIQQNSFIRLYDWSSENIMLCDSVSFELHSF